MPLRFLSGLCAALGALLGIGVSVAASRVESRPAPEATAVGVGWRGDGSGRYPQADPPIHWGRVAKSVGQLRAQANKPQEGDTGSPIPDGVVRPWLVVGPLPLPALTSAARHEFWPRGQARCPFPPPSARSAGF